MDIAANTRLEFVPGALCAAVVTASLLFLMCSLIATDLTPPEERIVTAFPDVIGSFREIPTIIEAKLIKPIDPAPVPDTPEFKVAELNPAVVDTSGGYRFTPSNGAGVYTPTLGSSGLIQQVMIAPSYPNRALSRGLEGFVDVRFAVTATGATTNVEVLRAEPEGVFDRAAMRAVKRWKYLPDEERKGELPVVIERIRFSIDQ